MAFVFVFVYFAHKTARLEFKSATDNLMLQLGRRMLCVTEVKNACGELRLHHSRLLSINVCQCLSISDDEKHLMCFFLHQ